MDIKPAQYYTLERRKMLRFMPRGVKTVLEVGCAEGHFGTILRSTGVEEVWGIEVCERAALEAMKKLDKVLVADIETATLSLPHDYFDCIIFNDILEHLSAPWGVLSQTRNSLKDDGSIVASIPNVRNFPHIKRLLWNCEWTYTDWGLLDRTHLRFFTKNSIIDLFATCGFTIHTLVGINEYTSKKFNLLNLLCAHRLDDMKYLQFACVARKT